MASRLSLFCLLLIVPFVLSACGEGWEAKLTNTHFPYGNERTAGSGIIYVRANLMPERELNLEPAPNYGPAYYDESVMEELQDMFEDEQVKK